MTADHHDRELWERYSKPYITLVHAACRHQLKKNTMYLYRCTVNLFPYQELYVLNMSVVFDLNIDIHSLSN